jgi:hypothetical protein
VLSMTFPAPLVALVPSSGVRLFARRRKEGGVRSRITASKICDMGIEGWYPKEWRQSAVRSGFEARRMELELVWSTFKSTLWIG